MLDQRRFGFRNVGHKRGIVLQRAVDQEIWPFRLRELRGFANFIHVGARSRFTGRVADHCNPRRYTECLRRIGALDCDIGERLNVRIRNHRAVAVHQNLLRQTHKEDRRNGLRIWLGLDNLQCGSDGIGS